MLRLAVLLACVARTLATNFTQCKEFVDPANLSIIYQGAIRGLQGDRPLTLTYRGCVKTCGGGPEVNSVLEVFQVLTTWVLPAVALLSQLPYESRAMKRSTAESVINWIGSPASALTSTIFNIHIIRNAWRLSQDSSAETSRAHLDAFYVLTCINQYMYPYNTEVLRVTELDETRNLRVTGHNGTRDPRVTESGSTTDPRVTERDEALLYGLLRPMSETAARPPNTSRDIRKTRELLANLAYQLRLQRRRAVYPLAFTVLWFLVAFLMSFWPAFANLGDNSTAHSLALGILLSWLPVLVVMAVVDRNPMNSSRCRVLIGRWLFNVHHVRQNRSRLNSPGFVLRQWRQNDPLRYDIGDFAGQGRRLEYCGIAHAVMALVGNHTRGDPKTSENPESLQSELEEKTRYRPPAWWIIWFSSGVIVSICFSMAFMISFNTPTVGLGCRSFCYVVWYSLNMVSWITQTCPPRLSGVFEARRFITLMTNTLAIIMLAVIILSQALNLFNGCYCKSSKLGSQAYGGYIDFENAQFYRDQFGVQRYWIAGAVLGLGNLIFCIVWALRRWSTSSALWKVDEERSPEQDRNYPDTLWLI